MEHFPAVFALHDTRPLDRHSDPERVAEHPAVCTEELTDDARGVRAAATRSSSSTTAAPTTASRCWPRCRPRTRGCASSGSAATSVRRRRSPPASPTRAAGSSSPPTATCRTTPATSRRWSSASSEGYDIVCGWRKDRKDPFCPGGCRRSIANRLISAATGVRAARLRLLAEGVPRRGGQAAEAVRRDAPLPAGHRERDGRRDRRGGR